MEAGEWRETRMGTLRRMLHSKHSTRTMKPFGISYGGLERQGGLQRTRRRFRAMDWNCSALQCLRALGSDRTKLKKALIRKNLRCRNRIVTWWISKSARRRRRLIDFHGRTLEDGKSLFIGEAQARRLVIGCSRVYFAVQCTIVFFFSGKFGFGILLLLSISYLYRIFTFPFYLNF